MSTTNIGKDPFFFNETTDPARNAIPKHHDRKQQQAA
jgi:hypothetical protein